MWNLKIAAATVAAFLVLSACANPSGNSTLVPYALKVAPRALTVNVPSSLVASSLGAAKRLSSARGFGVSGSGFFTNENRGSYHWVKDTMWQAQKRLARAAVRLVLVDSIISASGLVPAAVGATPTHQAATIGHVWTDAEVAAFTAMIPASFRADSSFASDAKLPKAGDTSNLPAFDFSLVDPADAVNSAYADKVVFAATQSEDDSAATLQETNSYYWSASKSQVKVAYEKDDVTVPAAPVVKELQFIAYDSSSSTLAAGRQGPQGSMGLTVKADLASTANGIFITFSSTINADKVSDYQSEGDINASGSTFALSADGYADNAGGYVDETLVVTVGSAAPRTFYFKESFDAAGKLVLAQSATDSTFATLTLIANVTGEDASGSVGGSSGSDAGQAYDSKKTAVETEHQNMDSSGVSTVVSNEQKHHAADIQGAGVEIEFSVPTGQAAPAVGETWGVYSDAAAITQLGSGIVTEANHLRVTFTATRDAVRAAGKLYLARLTGTTPDTTDVIAVTFAH